MYMHIQFRHFTGILLQLSNYLHRYTINLVIQLLFPWILLFLCVSLNIHIFFSRMSGE